MKVVKVEATFSREELENQKKFNKDPDESTPCGGVYCAWITCKQCPLYGLSREEVIEYIENHLEEEKE